MNKKFSTLLVGALLATAFTTNVSAQTGAATTFDANTYYLISDGTNGFLKGAEVKIAATGNTFTVLAGTGIEQAGWEAAPEADKQLAMWKVEPVVVNGTITGYKLKNKSTGAYLKLNDAASLPAAGDAKDPTSDVFTWFADGNTKNGKLDDAEITVTKLALTTNGIKLASGTTTIVALKSAVAVNLYAIDNQSMPIATLNEKMGDGFILNAKVDGSAILSEANGLFNKQLTAITIQLANSGGAITGGTDADKAVVNAVKKMLDNTGVTDGEIAVSQSDAQTFFFVSNAGGKDFLKESTNGVVEIVTLADALEVMELFKSSSLVAVDKVKSVSSASSVTGYGYAFSNFTGGDLLNANNTNKNVPVENAWMTIEYNGANGVAASNDDMLITVAAKFPNASGVMSATATVRPQIATVDGKNTLMAIPDDTDVEKWAQIGFGATSQVTYATFAGKSFNVISAEKHSSTLSDKVLGMGEGGDIAWLKATDVMKSKPEGQFGVTYDENSKEFTLFNRETGNNVSMGQVIYLVEGTTNTFFFNTPILDADTIQFVEAAACAHARLTGYAHSEVAGDQFDAVKLATTAYRLGIKNGDTDGIVYVQNSAVHNNTLSVAVKEDEGLSFYLVPAGTSTTTPDTISYGMNIDSKRYYENVGDQADSLRAVVYKLQERGNKRYVKLDADGKYVLDNNVDAAQTFLLKEREDGQYVILPVSYGTTAGTYSVTIAGKVYANIGDGFLHVENDMYRKNIADAFGLYESEAPKYANILKDINKGDTTLVKVNLSSVQNHVGDGFYMLAPGANNFLHEGVPAKGSLKAEGGLAYDSTAFSLVIDTAYINRGAGSETMPLYYIAMNGAARQDSVGPLHSGEKDEFGHPIVCPHFAANDTVIGKYLFAMYDSILYAKDKAIKSEDNCYHYTNTNHYSRLRFVDAKHINDTVIIANNRIAAPKDTLKAGTVAAATLPERKVFEWMGGFEVTDPALNAEHFGPNFQLTNDNFGLFAFEINPANEKEYAIYSPATGYYVAYLNGNVVMAPQASYYTLNVGRKDNPIVSNDDIQTSEMSVIAGEGQVVINNAAGKTVAISNILGQTIANTVLTSDNATIAVPAGIVVVAVEGEAAVKAIVR